MTSLPIWVELTRDAIDPQAILGQVSSTRAGAIVLFLGVVREFTGDKQTVGLRYESYPEMAEKKLRELAYAACEKWPLSGCAISHRLGALALADVAVAVAVSSPHRGDAFAAGQWLIDTLKEVAPIWKEEHWVDGGTEWVHPGITAPTDGAPALGTRPERAP